MNFQGAVTLLREFGFPVFVAVWFMWRLEKRIDRQSELMAAMMQATALLAKSIDDRMAPMRRTRTGPVPIPVVVAPLQEGKSQ